MNANPLVSIIIPTYNRAHLIGETLDSVLAQTYQNWECIVVDDGSTDETDVVMQTYCEKDSRFKYYHRPQEHLAGGNGARNFGFDISVGDYIQWFDSDDLMLPEKIELKVYALQDDDIDFVISKSESQNTKGSHEGYQYNFEKKDVNFLSFTTSYVTWITNDFMLKKRIANLLSYNENLKSGQEYNYVAKLLLITCKFKFIKNNLVQKRNHLDSIGKTRQNNKQKYWSTNFNTHWLTIQELEEFTKHDLPLEYYKYALFKCIRSYLEMNNKIKLSANFHKKLFRLYHFRALNFYLAVFSDKLIGKKEYFLKQLKK